MPKIIAKKQDWINLGYKLFSEKGIAGIVVEKMASILNVNKSSFYWHFKTKKEFVNRDNFPSGLLQIQIKLLQLQKI